MVKTYERANADTIGLLKTVMQKSHAELVDLKVRVVVLMVRPETVIDQETKQERPKGPAIKEHGHSAAARIKLGKAQDRLLAKYDALIEIDDLIWEMLSKDQRQALLDHELTHLGIRTNKDGVICNDDGTPKLETVPDDYMLTGFFSVIERHREHALEARSLRVVCENSQFLFEFMGSRRTAVKGGAAVQKTAAKVLETAGV